MAKKKRTKMKSINPIKGGMPYVDLGDLSQETLLSNRKIRTKTIGGLRLILGNVDEDCGEISHLWNLHSKEDEAFVGEFYVTIQSNGIAAISSSEIYDDYRHKGIGCATYTALVALYGILESDPNGNTSEEATNVWEALGAPMLRSGRFRLKADKLPKFKVKFGQ